MIGGCIAAGSSGQNYSTVLTMLLWLRELCCDARLLPPDTAAALQGAGSGIDAAAILSAATAQLGVVAVSTLMDLLRAGMDDDCCICLEPGGDCITRCRHVYHRACISKHLGQGGGATAAGPCPLCRAVVSEDELLNAVEEDTDDGGIATASVAGKVEEGSKAKALLQYLADHSGQSDGRPNKFVVFSRT